MAADRNPPPGPTEIQEHLPGVDYPADKQELVRVAKEHGAPDDVLQVLQKLEERRYDDPADVMKAVGNVG